MMKRKKRRGRRIVHVLIGLVVALMVSACAAAEKRDSPEAPGEEAGRPVRKVTAIGHRGAAGLAPENTRASFRKACESGVDAVELDVLFSADGKIVVHHDFRLKPEIARTPDGEWIQRPAPAINHLTLAELKTYDVGRLKPHTRISRRHPDQQPADGARIPTLDEVISLFETACDPAVQLWVEIKTSPEKPDLTPPPEKAADAVVALLRERKFTGRTRVLSFDWRSLARVQEIAPEIPTVYLSHVGVRLNNIKPGRPGPSPWMAGLDIEDFTGSIPRAVKAAGGRGWAPHHRYITYRLMKEAHELGLEVHVWTVDSRDEMARLIEMGVDGIITNRPDRLRELGYGHKPGQ
ncbi:MAG: glycerophosphodiester phosphodiesterase [Desulfobacterales bacterium]|nr:glycerophosphodiester phosphodiesterase [Desulfobacterales bacterium]